MSGKPNLVPIVRPSLKGKSLPNPTEAGSESVELLTRFVIGILVLGSDELLQRLRASQPENEANGDVLTQGTRSDGETATTLLRHLTIGLAMQGQRRIARSAYKGLRLSVSGGNRLLRTLDRLTDNRLARPLRKPVESLLSNADRELDLVIAEGRLEEQNSRMLAQEGVDGLVDDLLVYISENPELDEFVRRLIGQQSAGLAGVARDNTRQLSVTTDAALEGAVRRVLGLKQRKDMPRSPLMGNPQTMYAPEPERQETDHDRDE